MALAFRSRDHHASKSAAGTRAALLKVLETKYPPAASPAQEPTIPDPGIFIDLNMPRSSADKQPRLPNVAECCVHLRLLEAFFILKQKVATSNALDRALGIAPKDGLTTVRGTRVRKADTTFAERRKVKWKLFVRVAVGRFLLWWTKQTEDQVAGTILPPLDVVMVWHAYLLNHSSYRKFCEASTSPSARLTVEFPWAGIHAALSHDNRSYNVPSDSDSEPRNLSHVGPFDLFDALTATESQSEAVQAALKEMASSATIDEGNPAILFFSPKQIFPSGSDAVKARVKTLAAMVERQEQFVDKMANMLWLRSPALGGTLERAIVRYERFLTLFKENPGCTLVPTLDVDLVWHTHLCSPERYQAACRHFAGRETINHDDTLDQPILKDGFRRTERLYEIRFRDEYNACLCWECEAIRSELADWKKNCASLDGGGLDFVAVAKKAQEEVEYYQVVELARRTGKPVPAWKTADSQESGVAVVSADGTQA